jgi:hypothetical protein
MNNSDKGDFPGWSLRDELKKRRSQEIDQRRASRRRSILGVFALIILTITGTLTAALSYDPYGQPIPPATYTSGVNSGIGYADARTDPNTLIYLNARYYNPALGSLPNLIPWRATHTDHHPQRLCLRQRQSRQWCCWRTL